MADIGIMGGTFDPVHQAHLIIAQMAYTQLKLDKVLFMPGGNPPHKSGKVVSDKKIRCEMVRNAISDNPCFEICTYEVEKEEFSYTADTLEYLKAKNPDDNFFFIIGEDSLAYLEKWYKPEIIVKHAKLAAYGRGEKSDIAFYIKRIKKLLNAEVIEIKAPLIDISSTKIREYVKSGRPIKYMVPDSVIEIIEKEKLYQE